MKNKYAIMLLFVLMLPGVISEGNFNLKVDIPQEYQDILAGEEIFATFTLFNLDNEFRKDITIEYWVSGPDGEIGRRHETIAIETQASLVRSIEIPEGTSEGEHFLHARILFDEGKEQLSAGTFSVHAKSTGLDQAMMIVNENKTALILGGIALILLIILRFSRVHLKKAFRDWRLKQKIASIIKRRKFTS